MNTQQDKTTEDFFSFQLVRISEEEEEEKQTTTREKY